MELIPIQTPILRPGDDLAAILLKHGNIQPSDIIAISSKAVAIVEGRIIDYGKIQPTPEAHPWTKRCGGSPEFRQAVLDETLRMNGRVLPGCPEAMLTELKPDGFLEGVLLAANAGLDESNAPEGCCIGWPEDPVASVRRIRMELQQSYAHNFVCLFARLLGITSKLANQRTSKLSLAVLLTDSTCRSRRLGVTAHALVVSGFDPLRSLIGTKDLFGKSLRMTQEAVADQLATAANMVMGNADASVPAVIIRDHDIPFTDFEGWVPGIAAEDDLFQGL